MSPTRMYPWWVRAWCLLGFHDLFPKQRQIGVCCCSDRPRWLRSERAPMQKASDD